MKDAIVVDAGMLLLSQAREAGHRPPLKSESVLETWLPTSGRR
jgi:hypothetical protein